MSGRCKPNPLAPTEEHSPLELRRRASSLGCHEGRPERCLLTPLLEGAHHERKLRQHAYVKEGIGTQKHSPPLRASMTVPR